MKEKVNLRLKSLLKNIFKFFLSFSVTSLMIFFTSAFVTAIYFTSYVVKIATDPNESKLPYDLRAMKLNLTSFIYVPDENGGFKEYLSLHGTENRIWVDFNKIPGHMKSAIIAIEDKRFEKHSGVDWKRTFGAITSLFFGKKDAYGGSTLTQQTIKNLSEDSDVSLTRKIREIFRSLNMEKDYSKDEIMEAYLNVVNFGNGCRGVEAAAKAYFNIHIGECSLAKCAAIASITQNPSAFNPFILPKNNKTRREVILKAMLEQKRINSEEYKNAMEESEHMGFFDEKRYEDSDSNSNLIYNWYVEALINEVTRDLSKQLGIGIHFAKDMIFNQGLKIYSAMNEGIQFKAETVFSDASKEGPDNLERAFFMIDPLTGRVLATVGSERPKDTNLVFDRANSAVRQPGSSIKPVFYSLSIEKKRLNFSSLLSNDPVPNYFGPGKPGPKNWSSADEKMSSVLLPYAIEHSMNVPSVRNMLDLTPAVACDFLKELGMVHVSDADKNLSIALGGFEQGVTVREMASFFTMFASGGILKEPCTYYFVVNNKGEELLTFTKKSTKQVISSSTATIMNRLLRLAIIGPNSLAKKVDIPGREVIGKTGSTDSNKDYWFVGATPLAVAGIWCGYDNPKETNVNDRELSKDIWKKIMTDYLKDKDNVNYPFDGDIVKAPFCTTSGKLASSPSCNVGPYPGYYSKENLPGLCDVHGGRIHREESNFESDSSSSENHNSPNNVLPIENNERSNSQNDSSSSQSSQNSNSPNQSSQEEQGSSDHQNSEQNNSTETHQASE
ncbi:MAG: penicillin-binding protein [Oscillospiraceae bacterium]|jgi:penicillin-binding protein 1A|nr:penicillin-binding protein [Oscillospiraceae bacterium]